MPTLAIIIPVLNDAQPLRELLTQLQLQRVQCADQFEIIVVDGGSHDDSVQVAECYADRVLSGSTGRARQMQAGALAASTTWLWFLHADSVLPDNLVSQLQRLPLNVRWGRFDVQFDQPSWIFSAIAGLMNWRSRWSGICTGDQGLFVEHKLFFELDGYADIPIMEDVELSSRLRRIAAPHCIDQALIISGRRWRRHGVLRTIVLMWWLRLLFFCGVSPQRLHRLYYCA